MKATKTLLFIGILLLTFTANAQKVKLKKGSVLIDKVEWLTYTDCGSFDPVCSLYNADGDEIIFLKWISVPGEEPVTSSNTDGSLDYVEVVFLGKDKKYEVQKRQKNIILDLYKGKVINEDGTINETKVDRLIEKYGTEFSDRLNGTKNTIIIQENSGKKSSGSGLNIKIGN